MIIIKTIKTKLDISPAQVLPTIKAYTDAFNYICQIGWDKNTHDRVVLHNETYRHCRKTLPAQLSISAKTKAFESLRSVFVKRKKGFKVSCPHSKLGSIRYDHRSYNVWIDRMELSISTIDGRIKTSFKAPPYFAEFKSWHRKSADLVINNNKVYMHIVFEKEVNEPIKSDQVLGIDRGIKKIAVTSGGQFFGGGDIKRVVQKYRKLRAVLQSVGTKSSKRHLRKIKSKENRFRKDVNHCVSKTIVGNCTPGTTIVLEDLKNIRKRAKRFNREQRFWINNWSFFQLENFLRYKAKDANCFVDFVDAKYTSQKCSRCSFTDRGNRTKQSQFRCKKCGFHLNADLNAARNIAANFQDAISHLGRAAVNQPIVGNNVNHCSPSSRLL